MATRPFAAIFVVSALLAFPSASAAGEAVAVPGALTLAKAERILLDRHPVIKQIAAGGEIAAAREEEARAGRLPHVQGDATFMRTNNPVYVFGSLMEQNRFTADRFQVDKLNDPLPENNFRMTINAQYPIFDGFQTEVRTAQARLGVEETAPRRELAEQSLRLLLVRAYFGSLVAAERVLVAKEAVKTAEADAKKVADLAEVGLLVKSDLLAVQVQLADFRQQEIAAEAEEEIARAGLNSLLGLPEEARPILVGSLADKSFAVAESPEVVGAALNSRPELALGDLSVRQAGEGVRGAGNQFLPRADLFGTYGMSDDTLWVNSTDWTVGIKVSVPIFDGGRSARIGQAVASEVAAREGKRAEEDRIRVEAVAAHRRYRAAREKLAVAAGAVAQAAEAHRIVQDRYQVGLTTVTEVLRSENALLMARLGELLARYGIYTGYAEYLRAVGNLKNLDAF